MHCIILLFRQGRGYNIAVPQVPCGINAPWCHFEECISFMIAQPRAYTCTEVARYQLQRRSALQKPPRDPKQRLQPRVPTPRPAGRCHTHCCLKTPNRVARRFLPVAQIQRNTEGFLPPFARLVGTSAGQLRLIGLSRRVRSPEARVFSGK